MPKLFFDVLRSFLYCEGVIAEFQREKCFPAHAPRGHAFPDPNRPFFFFSTSTPNLSPSTVHWATNFVAISSTSPFRSEAFPLRLRAPKRRELPPAPILRARGLETERSVLEAEVVERGSLLLHSVPCPVDRKGPATVSGEGTW